MLDTSQISMLTTRDEIGGFSEFGGGGLGSIFSSGVLGSDPLNHKKQHNLLIAAAAATKPSTINKKV